MAGNVRYTYGGIDTPRPRAHKNHRGVVPEGATATDPEWTVRIASAHADIAPGDTVTFEAASGRKWIERLVRVVERTADGTAIVETGWDDAPPTAGNQPTRAHMALRAAQFGSDCQSHPDATPATLPDGEPCVRILYTGLLADVGDPVLVRMHPSSLSPTTLVIEEVIKRFDDGNAIVRTAHRVPADQGNHSPPPPRPPRKNPRLAP